MDNLYEMKACEVCGNGDLEPVLDLGPHPLCDDLVPIGEYRTCREYPIEILLCAVCATAQQRFRVLKRELFPPTYHYRSRFTADVLKGMSALVDSTEKRLGTLADKTVLDIGCNDGSLLDIFRAKGALTVGIEPTGAFADAENKGHRRIYNSFFSKEAAEEILKHHGQPDVITMTNVFAHIESLDEALMALRPLMSPTTALVIENHYLGSILDGNQFDTFYHEHPRSYSCSSFAAIARRLETNMQDVEFPSRYGGNIRVFLGGAKPAPTQAEALKMILTRENGYSTRFRGLRSNIEKWRMAKGRTIARLTARGQKIAAKAFPGRAAILIKMLGIDERTVSAVFEKTGSMKIGHYVPGTRIPIHSDEELFLGSAKPEPLLNLAWHIPEEIRSYLQAQGFRGEVIDILNATDFQ